MLVYNYLWRYATNLNVYNRQCGVKNPSWSELKHFVEFLNIQLRLCEDSIFCNEDIVEDVMSGFKTFVVKFMIRMSKVYTLLPYELLLHKC